jgi:anti-sigma B factor antagonist
VRTMSEPAALLQISPTPTGWRLDGEIDAHSAPALAEALATLPAGDVLLDVAGVTFMDSSGLRILVDASARAAAGGGRIVLVSPTNAVVRIVEISGLQDHLTLRP